METELINGIFIIISFFAIAVFSSILLKRINFPYTIGLVIAGGILGFLSYHFEAVALFKQVDLSPGIILYLILPVLIFDAALNIDYQLLYKNIVPVIMLAVIGLLISTVFIGMTLSFLTVLPLMGALVFGALISATDPVAVIALFNEIGAPKRLVTIIDGESIFNDATAIVLFTIIIGATTASGSCNISYTSGIWSFASVLLGGLLVGSIVGGVGSLFNNVVKNDITLQITISLIMAYTSFIISDHIFGFSGVMSTLASGIMMSASIERTVKRKNIDTILHFWEYFSFVANSIVFLLLGLTEIHVFKRSLHSASEIITIIIVIPLVLIARILGIYLLIPLYNLINKNKEEKHISQGFQAILFWGGLRGAVPVALVLAIPNSFPQHDLIVHFTFAFILFTLMCQGTTIKLLMEKLGIRPEKTDFGDKETTTILHDFETEGLAQLIMYRLKDIFDNEGFFIREKAEADSLEFLLKRKQTMFLVKQEGSQVSTIVEPKDTAYFNTIIYEGLLELEDSVNAIKNVTNPESIKNFVSSNDHSPEDLKVIRTILKYLFKDRLLVNVRADRKNEVIKELVEHMVEVNALPTENFDDVLEEVLQREQSMTTGLGNEIAIPHARSKYVEKITLLIAIAPRGIDFEAIDSKPVKVLMLIISPKNESGPHLQLLSALSKLMSEDEFRHDLLNSGSVDELYAKLVYKIKS